jgi:hypothetical protein
MRAILFTLMSLACTATMAASIYKWVDEDGIVHYSDQPHENAEKVQLKAAQTYSAPKTSPGPADAAKPARPAAVYTGCSVSMPTDDQVFIDTPEITAGVTVQPTIRPGDQVIVTMDGQRIPGVPAEGGQFTISPIDRGTHSLQMEVQDVKGKTLCQSTAVTFHVRQPSVLAPQNPLNPNRPKH